MAVECLVCGGPSNSQHFGARTCRACAAFFRRTVSYKLTYVCRRSSACLIYKVARCVCKCCRFKKCLDVGMRPEEVKPRSPDSSEKRVIPSTSTHAVVELIYLERLREAYEKLQAKRKELSSKMGVVNSPKRLTFLEVDAMYIRDIIDVLELLTSSFDEFQKLREDQARLVYKRFFAFFQTIEMGFFTARSRQTDLLFLPTGDFYDLRERDTYYLHGDGTVNEKVDELMRISQSHMPDFVHNMIRPLARLDVDLMELLAISAVRLWCRGCDETTDETEALATEVRNRLLTELIEYIRRKKITEPGPRICELLIIVAHVDRIVYRFDGTVEVARMNDLYRIDKNLYDYTTGQR